MLKSMLRTRRTQVRDSCVRRVRVATGQWCGVGERGVEAFKRNFQGNVDVSAIEAFSGKVKPSPSLTN